jgi:ArsR family transcriptional regulator
MSKSRTLDPAKIASWLKALSNPNRLEMFLRLAMACAPGSVCATQDEARACVGELCCDLNIAASTVSHHLKELRQAGLVHMERRGQNIDCWANQETLAELADFFSGLVYPAQASADLSKAKSAP